MWMQILYYTLGIVGFIGAYMAWKALIKSQVESGKEWFIGLAPFTRYRSDTKPSDGRRKFEYDPEADYDALELKRNIK